MCKKWIAALLVLALCLSFAACAPKETVSPEVVAPESQSPSPAIDGPLYTGTDIAASPFVGTFRSSYSALFASNADDVYVNITENEDGTLNMEPIEKPKLVCSADGSFALTVCTIVGGDYVTLNGTFTVDGETAEFTVAQGNYGDFLGSDTQKFALKLISHDELRYWGDQIGTVYGGDKFLREA